MNKDKYSKNNIRRILANPLSPEAARYNAYCGRKIESACKATGLKASKGIKRNERWRILELERSMVLGDDDPFKQ